MEVVAHQTLSNGRIGPLGRGIALRGWFTLPKQINFKQTNKPNQPTYSTSCPGALFALPVQAPVEGLQTGRDPGFWKPNQGLTCHVKLASCWRAVDYNQACQKVIGDTLYVGARPSGTEPEVKVRKRIPREVIQRDLRCHNLSHDASGTADAAHRGWSQSGSTRPTWFDAVPSSVRRGALLPERWDPSDTQVRPRKPSGDARRRALE